MVHDAAGDGGGVDRDGEARVLGDVLRIAAPPSPHIERDLFDQLAMDRREEAIARIRGQIIKVVIYY
jgi:hypothetical protein